MQIYNLLKKKHEEAKELIVRAVVNNNNLLMLNHPIYEQKISSQSPLLSIPLFHFVMENNSVVCSLTSVNIRKVQKFSLQLMSNKIQTWSAEQTVSCKGNFTLGCKVNSQLALSFITASSILSGYYNIRIRGQGTSFHFFWTVTHKSITVSNFNPRHC